MTRTVELGIAISHVTAVRNISIALLLSSAYSQQTDGSLSTTIVLAFGFYSMTIPGMVAMFQARKFKRAQQPAKQKDSAIQ
jgi:hypothetical protein